MWLAGLLKLKSVSSCWISADLVLWDPWNIKKAVCDLTIEPGQTFTRKPGEIQVRTAMTLAEGSTRCWPFFLFYFFYYFSQILSWPLLLWWWMTVIKLFLVFYHCTARTSGPLIEISDCQDLYTFHRRGWLTSPPLRLFLCGVWRSGAAQAAIFQIRLHFVSGKKKSRLRILGDHTSSFWCFLIPHYWSWRILRLLPSP